MTENTSSSEITPLSGEQLNDLVHHSMPASPTVWP